MMYLCDVHSHTRLSPDCGASLADMVEAAVRAGLAELCVTDHCDLLDEYGTPVAFFDWAASLAQFHAVKEQIGSRLILRLGLELGSAVFSPEAARNILRQGREDTDFVLGSLHNFIGTEQNMDFYRGDYRSRPDLAAAAMENALDSTWKLVTCFPDCYDSLAHITYPLRYAAEAGRQLAIGTYEERVRAIFTQVAQTGHALEVNTHAGRELQGWLPILKWFRESGGEFVTLGSDAHRPESVSRGIPEACSLLLQAGFRSVTTFAGRQPVLHPLDE